MYMKSLQDQEIQVHLNGSPGRFQVSSHSCHSPESLHVSSPAQTSNTIYSCDMKGTREGLGCWPVVEHSPALHKDLGSPQHWRGRKINKKKLRVWAVLRPRTRCHKLGFEAERNFAMVHLPHYKLYHATNC